MILVGSFYLTTPQKNDKGSIDILVATGYKFEYD
jgi:hypothetical protein